MTSNLTQNKYQPEMQRPMVTADDVKKAMDKATEWFYQRREEKGMGQFASILEIRGSIDEEVIELKEAMHEKDISQIEYELKDVIVAALFGLASINAWNR